MGKKFYEDRTKICDYDYECYLEDMAAKAEAEAHMYEDDNLYDEYLMSLNGN